jgi:hypothetical protein
MTKKASTANTAKPLTKAESAMLAKLQARANATPEVQTPAQKGLNPDVPPEPPVSLKQGPPADIADAAKPAVDTSAIDGEIEMKMKALQTLNDQLSGKVAYCPPDILAIVHEVLGNEFDAVVRAHTEAPLFELDILVPAQYSTMTVEQKGMIKEDHRVCVIKNGDGLNGVRQYCELVRDEIKRSFTTRPIQAPVSPISP